MRIRTFEDKNYRGIYFNGKTIRIALDSTKPIQPLDFAEFLDIKLTNKCFGKCPECYMDSRPELQHAENIVQKIKDYFGPMSLNERPFQCALGGGCPTLHPDFIECLKTFYELGITPNYTTNGMFLDFGSIKINDIIEATKKYCGGVAVSCHPHLDNYWQEAAGIFHSHDIKLNFHIIISDPVSSDRFRKIYDKWKNQVEYFVLLPYGIQGRAKPKEIDWEYLCSVVPKDTSKVAFGANFHPYLVKTPGSFNVSLYDPESMSRYLDLVDMKEYRSSFDLNPIN